MHGSIAAQQGNKIAAILERSAALPANCFTIDAKNGITEGFILSNHPLCGGKLALVLGERFYIMRDQFNKRGCIYQPMGNGTALVRRAQIGGQFPLFQKLDHEGAASFLLYIQSGLKGGKLKAGLEPLWNGTFGGTQICREQDAELVELQCGSTCHVLYPAGGILQVSNDGGKIAYGFLEPEEILERRLELVESMLESAVKMEGADRRAKAEDRAFHELASMLRLTAGHVNLRQRLLDEIERLTDGRVVRPGVHNHFRQSLEFLGDTTWYGWLFAGSDVSQTTGTADRRSEEERKQAAERRRKADQRRAENRAKRLAAQPKKGPTGSTPSYKSKKK